MFKSLINKAKIVTESNDKENPISSAQDSDLDNDSLLNSKSNEVYEQYWPKIESIIIEKALPLVEDTLESDSGLVTLFEMTYEMLPGVIRIVLSREKFIEFCLNKKEPLLHKIKDYRAGREDASLLDKIDD